MVLSSEWQAERADITARLSLRRSVRTRIDDHGEAWLDHHCIFHDDTHRSATWKEDSGTYYCRTEDKTFPVPDVLSRLNMRESEQGHGNVRLKNLRSRPLPVVLPDLIYTYVFPDGRASHMKWRWNNPKRFSQVAPDGSAGLPVEIWPVYGDHALEHGLHILVVEGEKCVDRVQELADALDQVPIRALTCGSAADLRNHAAELVARIGELQPKSICLWPDNDEPGLAAMRAVHSALQKQGIAHATIQPASLGLPLKGDLIDWVAEGNSLATLVARQSGALDSEPITELLLKTSVTKDGHLVSGRALLPINEDSAKVMWWQAYGQLPTNRQLQEYLTRIRVKSQDGALVVRPRAYTNERVTWWRPADQGQCLRIDAQGIDPNSEDPPGVFLLAPEDGRHVDTSVDLSGEFNDLLELLSIWELSNGAITAIVGWLVCAMGGLQTPILFMKSSAGTGKTTLARFLLSVIEPLTPEYEPNAVQDYRAFQRQVVTYPVAMIDNASRVEGRVEDLLSRLVTGTTVTIRPLYENDVVTTFLRRAIIITTTNYNPYKGDAVSRMIIVTLTRKTQAYFSDRSVQRRLGPIVPKVRGYIMKCLSRYFAERDQIDETQLRMRIGDLGVVLETLGFDSGEIEAEMAQARSDTIASNDAWFEAFHEMLNDDGPGYDMMFKETATLLQVMNRYGCVDTPPLQSPRLRRWFEEKATHFRDVGWEVVARKTNPRGYEFRRIDEPKNEIPTEEISATPDLR